MGSGMTHHDPHQPIVAFDEHIDSWHRHTVEEGQPQEEHGAQANPAALVGAFLGSIFFVGSVIVVCLLYYGTQTTAMRQRRIETTALAGDYFEYRDRSELALRS